MSGNLTLSAGLTTPFRETAPVSNQLAKSGSVTVQVAFASAGRDCALTNHTAALAIATTEITTISVSLMTLARLREFGIVCIDLDMTFLLASYVCLKPALTLSEWNG